QASVASAVLEGLSSHPKCLPPWLFYDRRGSDLFERITHLPEYYPTRTELHILESRGAEIARSLGGPRTVLELGSGSARKSRVLLRHLMAHAAAPTYIPSDVSGRALDLASESLALELPGLSVAPLLGTHEDALGRTQEWEGPRLVLFLGSSLGNYDPSEAIALLSAIRAALQPSDRLLLGLDMRKPESILLPAYDDAAGVTAAFNRNVLVRLNRELGGDADPLAFEHVALWNAAQSRIEMHLESRVDQTLTFHQLEQGFAVKAGERIHTENSYKYGREDMDRLFAASGLALIEEWRDPEDWFSLLLLGI
ncbi:MAG TPA: L-histidine N(alpha)-methyltransferase, partial [Holophagaceae bacterium]|nr:L-histidine N(alpha)-methyltransferase [Holophagaceae bacterium]